MIPLRQSLMVLILFSSMITWSQKVSSYRWSNRVLMILSENPGSAQVKLQMSLFADQSEALDERKLIILQVFPNYYLKGSNNFIRRDDNQLYYDNKTTEAPFEVVLIGLDGGLKFRKKDVVVPADLYALIDAMPMRRAEGN